MKNKDLVLTLHPKHMHIRTPKPLRPIPDSSFHRKKRMTALPAVSEEYVKPKVVLFYKNGDRNFRGSHVTVTSRQFRNFDNLLNELTRITNLSQGARYVFTPETGTRIGSLDELSDGKSYVCGSYPRLKKINYNHAPDGSKTQDKKKNTNFVPAISKQKLNVQKDGRTQTNIKPKIIHIIRNGISVKRKVTKVLLNKRTAQSYEQVLNDITETVGVVSSGFVRKLYNKNGKLVVNLSELFGDDDVFIAVGSEKFRPSDAPALVEEAGLGKSVTKSDPSLRVTASVSPVPSPPKTSPLKKKKTRQMPLSQHKKLPSIGKRAEPEGEPAKSEDTIERNSPLSNVNLVSLNEQKPQVIKERSVEDILQDFMEGYNSDSKKETPHKPTTPQKEPSIPQKEPSILSNKEPSKLSNEETSRSHTNESDHFVKNESPRLSSASSKHSEIQKEDDYDLIENKDVIISDEDGSDTDSSTKSDSEDEDVNNSYGKSKSDDDIEKNSHKNIDSIDEKPVEHSNIGDDKLDKSDEDPEKLIETNVEEHTNDNANIIDILAVLEEKEDQSKSEELYTERLTKIFNDSSEIDEYYDIGKKLGDGNFAVVNKVIDKRNNKTFAMKVIDAAKMEGKLVMLNNEIKIQRGCSHPNIVQLYHDMHSPTKIYLIMELVTGGDFFDLIANNVSFEEEDASTYMRDLCSGLDYLHQREIVHRDIKPENLMVYETNGQIVLKIADFGLAMKVTSPIYTICGTPTYVAPEILTEEGYGLEVDVWAAGIILYIMLCGFPPFRSPNRKQTELFDLIEKGEFEFLEPYWDDVSSGAKDLISKTLIVNKKNRFTARQIFQHEWLVQFRLSRNNTLVDITPRKSNRFKTTAKGIQSIERMKLLLGTKLEREQFITHVHDNSNETVSVDSSHNESVGDITTKDNTTNRTNDVLNDNDVNHETKNSPRNDDAAKETNDSESDDDIVVTETRRSSVNDNDVLKNNNESGSNNHVGHETKDDPTEDNGSDEPIDFAKDDINTNETNDSKSDDGDDVSKTKSNVNNDEIETNKDSDVENIVNKSMNVLNDKNNANEVNGVSSDDDEDSVGVKTNNDSSDDDDIVNKTNDSATNDDANHKKALNNDSMK